MISARIAVWLFAGMAANIAVWPVARLSAPGPAGAPAFAQEESGQEGDRGGKGQDAPKRPKQDGRPFDSIIELPADFVQFSRLPEGATRPRLGSGSKDLALIYCKNEGKLLDLYLTRTADEAKTFSPAVRLNAAPGTVMSLDGMQSGSVDVGPDGRVHVAWISAGEKPTLQYVRTTPDGGLEPVQDLGSPAGLGSTTAVTVGPEGEVYVVYAADGVAREPGEEPAKRIWLRRAVDGVSFAEPDEIDLPSLSVSDHSEIAAHVDELMGTVFVLYRTAALLKRESPVLSRTMRLLSSEDKGVRFESSMVDNLRHQRDPRSGAYLAQEKNSTLACWETEGRACWSIVRRQLNKVNLPVQAKAESSSSVQTHAVGAAGGTEVILTWLERPDEERKSPPKLGWTVWFREGRFAIGSGYAPEPASPTGQVVFPRKAGGFTILY